MKVKFTSPRRTRLPEHPVMAIDSRQFPALDASRPFVLQTPYLLGKARFCRRS